MKLRSLKQLFCVHWFDDQPSGETEYSAGAIICCEQRLFKATVQSRKCSKCKLEEERNVDVVCLGWY